MSDIADGDVSTQERLERQIWELQTRITSLKARRRRHELKSEQAMGQPQKGISLHHLAKTDEALPDALIELRGLRHKLERAQEQHEEDGLRIGSESFQAPVAGWVMVAFKPISAGGRVIQRGQTITTDDLAQMGNASVLLSSGTIRWAPPPVEKPPRPPQPQAVQPPPSPPADAMKECRAELRRIAREKRIPLSRAIDLLPKDLHNAAQRQYANEPRTMRDGTGDNAPMIQNGRGSLGIRRSVAGFPQALYAPGDDDRGAAA
jgi:hypothetical protein